MQLAEKVDMVVVVGGYNSGNTRRLVQVIKSKKVRCLHVEKASEVDPKKFQGLNRIGITAGASTPTKIINEVEERLKEFCYAGTAG
jgi:4-hydroxy-3-methylbut-2-enyl diphosphate reductase